MTSSFRLIDASWLLYFIESCLNPFELKHAIREMVFEQPFFDNFCDNFLFHTHTVFLFYLSVALIFVSLPKFLLCIIWLSNKLSQKNIVQITFLSDMSIGWKYFVIDSNNITKMTSKIARVNFFMWKYLRIKLHFTPSKDTNKAQIHASRFNCLFTTRLNLALFFMDNKKLFTIL
jgi:hypothetical protein